MFPVLSAQEIDRLRRFGIVRNYLAGEKLVDRAREEREPPLELRTSHRGEGGQPPVRRERAARVAAAPKNHCLPKRIHLRQVCGPVGLGDVGEDETQQLVVLDLRVESVHEALDICATGEVRAGGGRVIVDAGLGVHTF